MLHSLVCNVNIAACGEHMANSVAKTKDFWRRRRKSKKSFVFTRNPSSSPQNPSSSPQNPSSWLNWHDWQYWRRKHKLTAVTFSSGLAWNQRTKRVERLTQSIHFNVYLNWANTIAKISFSDLSLCSILTLNFDCLWTHLEAMSLSLVYQYKLVHKPKVDS